MSAILTVAQAVSKKIWVELPGFLLHGNSLTAPASML
jgi:hypothetical protein